MDGKFSVAVHYKSRLRKVFALLCRIVFRVSQTSALEAFSKMYLSICLSLSDLCGFTEFFRVSQTSAKIRQSIF